MANGHEDNGSDEKTLIIGGRGPSAKLSVVEGPDQGRVFPLSTPVVTVGRATDNAVVLRDPSVSRYHCKLERIGLAGFKLLDSGSGNGVDVDGELYDELELRNGAMITLGNSVLRYTLEGTQPAPAAQRPSASKNEPPAGGTVVMPADMAIPARAAQPQQSAPKAAPAQQNAPKAAPAAPAAKASPAKAAPAKAAPPPKSGGGGGGAIVAGIVALLVIAGGVWFAGEKYMGWWNLTGWFTPTTSSSSTSTSGGSACRAYAEATCKAAGGNQTACDAAKQASAQMTESQCEQANKLMQGAVGGQDAAKAAQEALAAAGAKVPGDTGALSDACKAYTEATCKAAGGNEAACEAAKVSAKSMTDDMCNMAVKAMEGGAAAAADAAKAAADAAAAAGTGAAGGELSAACKAYAEATCKAAGGNQAACDAASASAKSMTDDMCNMAVKAMQGGAAAAADAAKAAADAAAAAAGAGAAGGTLSDACKAYADATCKAASGNQTACDAALASAKSMTDDMCNMAVKAMQGAMVPPSAPAGELSAACKAYVEATCKAAGGNQTACDAATTAAKSMSDDMCNMAVKAMQGAMAPPSPGGAELSEACKSYVDATCKAAGGNQLACDAATTAAKSMTDDMCAAAAKAIQGATP
jgi:hypothetical protein